MSPKQDTILLRIKKLLNLTEARGATPDEAANAAAKVQALLFEHNLSMAAVESVSLETPTEKIEETFTQVRGAKNSMRWRQALYSCIARNHFCKVLFSGKTGVLIFGKPSNVEVVQYMAEYIGREIHAMARKGMLDEQKRTSQKVSWPYYTAFAHGAVSTIGRRLDAQMQTFEQTSTALVVQSRGAVEVFIKDKYPKLGHSRPLKATRADAYQHGQTAAHGISLTKGITSAPSTTRRIS